ncbi:MAG: hypothetical protein NVS2B12_02450 [Ktedonobacteraceae bacterium]
MMAQKKFMSMQPPRWILLPLRLFLGITFIYAGIQKLADPQFFQPGAAGYIGKQFIGYAHASPLHDFLLQVAAPHAILFGLLVAYGEVAIGLGTLIGFLLRPAAFFGMLLSVIFYLSISWKVYPYFYGSDIVFAFCWLTLFLNGSSNTGFFTIDELLSSYVLQRSSPERQTKLATRLHLLLGTIDQIELETFPEQANTARPGRVVKQRSQSAIARSKVESRRSFLFGTLLGGAGTLGLVAAAFAWRLLNTQDQAVASATSSVPANDAPPTPLPSEMASPTAVPSAASTQTTAAIGNASVIARVDAVPKNSAVNFTLARSGDPGVLIHLNNGQFVAYDATCTHAGCQVDYDPASQHLVCPCHGAEFDPGQQGAVLHPPADTPLTTLTLHVDSATGVITLKQ